MDTDTEKSSLSEFIKEKACHLGFDRVGIARTEHLNGKGGKLQKWLGQGLHGTMEWMEKRSEERKDVGRYFPEAQSMVCVALNYFHGHARGDLKISNYAWGDDYHEVMSRKLNELLEEIERLLPEVRGVVCVDTSPVMEKAWAQRAGIGWIGKHTNVITRERGSWIFLGELILDCELKYDSPFDEDLCGSCTACVEACPTGAIVEEYLLDANRCISYLTIEHKGNLPADMAPRLDGWIYGCDVCQEVCPWNVKFARPSIESSFAPREENTGRSNREWLELTEDDFRRSFRKSPVKRAKFEGLKRNILANQLRDY